MKREEAIAKIAAILDQLEEGGDIIHSISIRPAEACTGLIKSQRVSFAKRVKIAYSKTLVGEFIVVTEPAR